MYVYQLEFKPQNIRWKMHLRMEHEKKVLELETTRLFIKSQWGQMNDKSMSASN